MYATYQAEADGNSEFRILARAAGIKDPNSALDIDRGTFDGYCRGFEAPGGEGEIVIDATWARAWLFVLWGLRQVGLHSLTL